MNIESSGRHRVVSSEQEELILVDADDNEIGYRSKADCHDGQGVMHRAFSLFLFNELGQLLLQQRSATKRLWPEFWSNSCCSHPRRGETLSVAMARRLRDELNISADLDYVYHFCYQAQYDDEGSENELCHVYLGTVSGEVQVNEHEIKATRFVSVADLNNELAAQSQQFTPWFKQEWRNLNEHFGDDLQRYAM